MRSRSAVQRSLANVSGRFFVNGVSGPNPERSRLMDEAGVFGGYCFRIASQRSREGAPAASQALSSSAFHRTDRPNRIGRGSRPLEFRAATCRIEIPRRWATSAAVSAKQSCSEACDLVLMHALCFFFPARLRKHCAVATQCLRIRKFQSAAGTGLRFNEIQNLFRKILAKLVCPNTEQFPINLSE